MSVANVKVQHIRPLGYQNLKEWMADEAKNVYVGRRHIVLIDGKRFPQIDSPFANPFKVGVHGDLSEILDMYEKYIRDRLKREPILRRELLKLKGKCLGCWCKPNECHADILLSLSEEYHKIMSGKGSYTNMEEECCICDDPVNESCGWLCEICDRAYCDDHNDSMYTCSCIKE